MQLPLFIARTKLNTKREITMPHPDDIFSFKLVGATIGGVLSMALGGIDVLLNALLMFIALDVVTGVAEALIGGKWTSQEAWRGGVRKVGILCVVAVAVQLDKLLPLNGETSSLLRSGVMWFYLISESLSALQHLAHLGVPIPDVLLRSLQQGNRGNGAATTTPTAETPKPPVP